MKKEILTRTVEQIKEYNDDLFSLTKKIRKMQKSDEESKSTKKIEQIQEALILVSILLSGNIKARYELDTYLKDNKAFANMASLKAISTNCKQDIEALRSISFSLVETLKSIKQKDEEQRYREQTL